MLWLGREVASHAMLINPLNLRRFMQRHYTRDHTSIQHCSSTHRSKASSSRHDRTVSQSRQHPVNIVAGSVRAKEAVHHRTRASGSKRDDITAETPPKVVILGGTGRIGASTAAALAKQGGLNLVLASRKRASYDAAVKRRPELAAAKFHSCDIDDRQQLDDLLEGAALVIHAAGPFQRKEGPPVLEAAIANKIPYLDVCDDSEYSQRVKEYSKAAEEAGVPAITSAGIYPGTSNVMAAHMISIARKEYDKDWNYVGPPKDGTKGVEPQRVRYSYYTAGSGGAGPTIMETTFLLAGQPVEVFKDGQKLVLPPLSEHRVVDFGEGLGMKSVYLYQLPEVASTHRYLRVPSVSARFGTDPIFWNWAMQVLARVAPTLLADRSRARALANWVDPVVRLLDPLVGEKVAMRVDVDLEDGTTACSLFVHKLLSVSVGISIASFARAMLAGGTAPGVWYPEEPQAISDRRAFLRSAVEGCSMFSINKPAWELESTAKQVGMGLYF